MVVRNHFLSTTSPTCYTYRVDGVDSFTVIFIVKTGRSILLGIANQGIFITALGSEKITEFASKPGISVKEAAGGLSEAHPQMVDKASGGGALLESIGGVEEVLGVAKKIWKINKETIQRRQSSCQIKNQ